MKEYMIGLNTGDIRRSIKGLAGLRKLVAADANMEKLYHYGSEHTIKALNEYTQLTILIDYLNSFLENNSKVELDPDDPWIQTSMLDMLGDNDE